MKAGRGPIIAAVVAAAVLAVGVLIAVSAAGGDDDAPTTASTAVTAVAAVDEVQEDLAGVESVGARIGAKDAPVGIEEFADLQCPFCAQAASAVMPRLIDEYVRPGTVKVTFRTLAFIGPDSRNGALAAQAARKQDRLWEFTEIVFRNQGGENDGWLSDEFIGDVADAMGLDRARFDADRASDEAAAAVDSDTTAATQEGVSSTPTFVVTGPGGRKVLEGAQDYAAVKAAIEEVRG